MNKSTEDSRPIRNWPEYNQSLCNRSSITLWVNEEVVQQWYNEHITGKPGASKTYNYLAIECLLSLKVLYRLSLRAVTGFVASIFELMGLDLALPDYKRSVDGNVTSTSAHSRVQRILFWTPVV